MTYVDGFLLTVPKKNIEAYRKISSTAGEVWMEYGALSYKECTLDDMSENEFCLSFPKGIKAKDDEIVVFSFITYESRAHRDEINKKVMEDSRIQESCNSENMPFDPKNMMYGGFTTFVDM